MCPAGGNLTVSGGCGTGSIVSSGDITAGNFTFDASNFGGAIDVKDVSASGSSYHVDRYVIRVFSASGVNATTNFTLDGAANSGALRLPVFPRVEMLPFYGQWFWSLGSGSGSTTGAQAEVGDASNFGGGAIISAIVSMHLEMRLLSTGGDGDFSGSKWQRWKLYH